jgi:uncharacterized glyoxalase superfamily protein PhnB
MHAHATGPSGKPSGAIVPILRYRDVAAAIDWLCGAFGFERHLVVPDEDGTVRYAELTFGGGMIMLGPVEQSAFDGLMTQPADTGGAETQICYLFVEDAAAHCARAKAAGAEIVLDIEEDGGRGFSGRDPEGHIWNFGTYDPWRRQAREPPSERPQAWGADWLRDRLRELLGLLGGRMGKVAPPGPLACLLLAVAVSAGAAGWAMGGSGGPARSDGDTAATETARRELALARADRDAAEAAAKEAREQLVQERRVRETAERAAKEADRTAKEAERTIKEAERAIKQAERVAREVESKAREQAAREAAREAAKAAPDQAAKEARELHERLSQSERALVALKNELAAERTAREAADRATYQVREQLALERRARETAERAAKEAAENAAKEAGEKESRERKDPAAAPRKPQRRAYSAPRGRSPPPINWFGG